MNFADRIGKEAQFLRELQYEYNRRQIAMMDRDYERGAQVLRSGWQVNEQDIERRRQKMELEKLYKDAYMAWEGVHENMEYQEFGTSPVKNAYWRWNARGPYVWNPHNLRKRSCVKTTHVTPPAPMIVFRRFDNLLLPEEQLDVLVKALLGFPQPMGYKYGNYAGILNDSWMVNLRSTEEDGEDIMVSAFLNGFGGGSGKQLNKAVEGKHMEDKRMVGVDVSDELNDLLRVYSDAEEHLKKNEANALESMTHCMKRYLEVMEERKKLTQKIKTLELKLQNGKQLDQDEGEEHEYEEKDED